MALQTRPTAAARRSSAAVAACSSQGGAGPVQGSLVPAALKAAVCRQGRSGVGGDEVEARRPARRRGGELGTGDGRFLFPGILFESSSKIGVHLEGLLEFIFFLNS